MGSLLKESLFSLLCSQKVVLPPNALPKPTGTFPSAQLSGRCEGVTLKSWCHFWHCFTTKPPFGDPHHSLMLFSPHSWQSAPIHASTLLPSSKPSEPDSVSLSTPLPPASMSYRLLPGSYTSSIFSALPAIFSRVLTHQVVPAKLQATHGKLPCRTILISAILNPAPRMIPCPVNICGMRASEVRLQEWEKRIKGGLLQ